MKKITIVVLSVVIVLTVITHISSQDAIWENPILDSFTEVEHVKDELELSVDEYNEHIVTLDPQRHDQHVTLTEEEIAEYQSDFSTKKNTLNKVSHTQLFDITVAEDGNGGITITYGSGVPQRIKDFVNTNCADLNLDYLDGKHRVQPPPIEP